MKLPIILLSLCALASLQTPAQQPIIGIYTQDADDFLNLYEQTSTYIAASYVKNMEMAGAQVVPLFYHYSYAQLEDILSKINGVYFPGNLYKN